MGRINVTIRIFAGTLVPNQCCLLDCTLGFCALLHRKRKAHGAMILSPDDARAPRMDTSLGHRYWLCGGPLLVTVLAQDHCYSDLLRFVLDNLVSARPAMTMQHCPSA